LGCEQKKIPKKTHFNLCVAPQKLILKNPAETIMHPLPKHSNLCVAPQKLILKNPAETIMHPLPNCRKLTTATI
jgi:hypothetical protein